MASRTNEGEVNVEFDGRTYAADYSVSGGVVSVSSDFGSSATQVGGSTAESIARMLLREMLQSAKAKGEI